LTGISDMVGAPHLATLQEPLAQLDGKLFAVYNAI
jgi:hypothetical protein